jgi:hypothetical protein
MTRTDFQQLALERLADARALQAARRWGAAYYLAGYAIECALKACIAKKTRAEDFPIKDGHKFYVHVLDELIRHASLEVPRARETQWGIVRRWSEQCRYDPPKTQQEAADILEAITDVQEGILPWLQTHW